MPAAAVIRGVQALSGFIGRKESVGALLSFCSNTRAQLWEGWKYWQGTKDGGATRTVGVGVKSVDIDRNAKGEGV